MSEILHVECRILGLLVLILMLTSTNSEWSPSIDLGYIRLQTGPTLPTRTQVLKYASDFFILLKASDFFFAI